MARIVVSGYMVRFPLAGMLMAYFQYLYGLARLGHEVVYIEESGWAAACFDPHTQVWQDDPAAGLAIVGEVMAQAGLTLPLIFVRNASGSARAEDMARVAKVVAAADLVLDLGGVNPLPALRVGRRSVLVDMDPFFTQVHGFASDRLDEYDHHFSYGANIGCAGCSVPTRGINWLPTRPPVVPELWATGPPPPRAPITTIASWSAYGGVEYEGVFYGQKDREFIKLLDLPARTHRRLELALAGAGPETWAQLRSAGWSLVDASTAVTKKLSTYRDYLAASWAELSAAKHAYVATRSGWFSDRSACYLTMGRPVMVQDTGFSDGLPTGSGLLPFSSVDEAVACIERLEDDYALHARAARAIAEEYFSYKVVLPRLLEMALA
jgi:hypothetical protein